MKTKAPSSIAKRGPVPGMEAAAGPLSGGQFAPTAVTTAGPTGPGGKQELGSADQFWGYQLGGRGGELFTAEMVISNGVLTQQGMRDLWHMACTDETVGAMIWCIVTALTSMDFFHVAQLDGQDVDENSKSDTAAQYADQVIADMDQAWSAHLEEAVSAIIFGYACCEIIPKQRDGVASRFNDDRWGVSACWLRDQFTIFNWKYDPNSGQPMAFVQQTVTKGAVEVPLWKTCHYRMLKMLNRPQGRALLLPAWRAWKLKNRIQDSEAIGIDRDLAGIPLFRMPQEVLDTASETGANLKPTKEALAAIGMIQAAQKAVSQLRMNHDDGLVIPSDTFASDDPEQKDRTPKFDFKLITSAGPRTINTRQAVQDYDLAIARTVLMMFLQLGTKGGGSYALSGDQSETAYASVKAIADMICEEWSKKVNPYLAKLNGANARYLPRLSHGKVTQEGMQAIGEFLNGIGRAVNLWENDAVMRESIAELTNLKFDPAAQAKAAKLPPAPAFGQKPPGAAPQPVDPNQPPAKQLPAEPAPAKGPAK